MAPSPRDRYSRQILFPPIGEQGQARIAQAKICIVGCGALGSFQAEALARAGVGSLRLIDRDYVEYSNLQRQWLFDEADAQAELPKAAAAQQRLHSLNRDVVVDAIVTDLAPSNAEDLLVGFDLILDATDNFETRYLINDISVKHRTPWIYGSAVGSYGLFMPLVPGRGPCFACVYPTPPSGPQPTCDVDGVIGPAPAAVASLQVAAAMRLLVDPAGFKPVLQTLDVWKQRFRQIDSLAQDTDCPVCVRGEFRYLDQPARVPVSLCGRNAVQLHERQRTVNLEELAARLGKIGSVRVNGFALRVDYAGTQVTVFPDGRAIVKGTTDVSVARGIYGRLLGN